MKQHIEVHRASGMTLTFRLWVGKISDGTFYLFIGYTVKTNVKILCINSIHSSFQFTCNYCKECVQFWDVSVSVDNSGNITTDLYVKPTDMHQCLPAISGLPNHTKRSIPHSQALRILRICSNKESAKLRCTELVDSMVKRGYNK